MRNKSLSTTQLLDATMADLRNRLPERWILSDYRSDVRVGPDRGNARIIDAILEIRDPLGLAAEVILEVTASQMEPRFAEVAAYQLKTLSLLRYEDVGNCGAVPIPMLIAPFLSQLARERLEREGISYADSTGNFRFSADRPAIFISEQGSDRNPFREKRPLQSLKGGRSGRVVRGFLDFKPPFGTRELAGKIGSTPASVSRVADLLERDAIVTRESPRGRIESVDWESLVRRWVMDYDFTTSNEVTIWLEPRGTWVLFERLRETDIQYAVTGSFAANRLAPFTEPRLLALYTEEPEEAAEHLRLRPTDTGGNVMLVRPFDPVALERTECADGIRYARVTQVLVDLMTGPGRGPTEAEALLAWMKDNEDTWKLPLTRT